MSKGDHRTAYLLVAAVIITALVAGGVTYVLVAPPARTETTVTVYDWWTSGGEHAAMQALIHQFNVLYPNITVIEYAVAGGAGSIMQSVVKPLVLAHQAPDAFQMHAGYEGYPYYAGGYLDPITSLWAAENWEHYIPPVVAQMCKFGSDYYAVPVNIHRANVLWYNLTICNANNINPAVNLTTWTGFFQACAYLSTHGYAAPIALGDSGSWAAEHVFEQMLASEGIGFYQDFVNGKVTSSTNTSLVDALTKFQTYMTYVNGNHAALTWDQAIARIMSGTSVFSIMGDWANGEFTAANGTSGRAPGAIHWGGNYGARAVPETQGYYGLVIDCFQHPKGTLDPGNSLLWLTVVGSKAGQDAFNPLKGSIAARNDSDISAYGAYQRLSAHADFVVAAHMFPSFTHGSGLPAAVGADVNTAIANFVAGASLAATASAITASVVANSAAFTTVWSL